MRQVNLKLLKTSNFGYFFFLIYFLVKFPNNGTGLADAYQFRQTQTTWGIREAMRHGLDFQDLRMPVLGYPYKVPFEFPLFQNVAAFIGSLLNLSDVEAGRMVSLSFFCIGGILTFNLISKLTSAAVAISCVSLFYLTPFAIEWSNAVLIESFANFFLISAAVFLRKYFERGSNFFLMLFGIAFGFCALVKITTALPVIFFLIIFLSWNSNFEFRMKQQFQLSTVVIISIIPSFAWTRYADSIKEKGLLTEWLTSGSLQNWNFGTFSQRFSEADWIAVFARFWLLGGLIFLLLFPILTIINFKKGSVTKLLFICAMPIVAPLFFFNLYVVHDYYFMAVLFPSILSFSYLLQLTQNKFSLNLSRVSYLCILVILLLPSWIFTVQNRDYKSLIVSARNEIPAISNEIKLNTSANDRILVVGCDWDPSVLFYADRYGIAAPGWIGSTDEALEILRKNVLIDTPNFLAICGNNLAPSSPVEKGLKRISENIWKIEDVNKLN